MAVMTTALTEFTDNGNSRQYTYTGHTAVEPRMVLQRRRPPSGQNSVIEDEITVLSSTEDSLGEPLDSKILISVKVRRPIKGIAADVTAALAIARDIVAGDEFANTVDTQQWLI